MEKLCVKDLRKCWTRKTKTYTKLEILLEIKNLKRRQEKGLSKNFTVVSTCREKVEVSSQYCIARVRSCFVKSILDHLEYRYRSTEPCFENCTVMLSNIQYYDIWNKQKSAVSFFGFVFQRLLSSVYRDIWLRSVRLKDGCFLNVKKLGNNFDVALFFKML